MPQKFPLDLQDNKILFRDFISQKTEFTDYNFESSGISQVQDILSFNTQQHAFYLNQVLNEIFIVDAKLENNIYKLANMLNYIPKRKSAPYCIVSVTRIGVSTVIIPIHTKFKIGDVAAITMEEYTLDDDFAHEIRLFEGEFITEVYQSTGVDFEEFEVQNLRTVDNDFFDVFVDTADEFGVFTYTKFLNANLSDFDVNRNNYYMKYIDTIIIKFDDESVFNKPNNGDYVRFEYLNTNGTLYNNISGDVVCLDPIGSSFTINSLGDVLRHGTDEESLEGIKLRAPLFFTTQGRAVTVSDYNIMLSHYSEFDSFTDGLIWSGSDEFVDFEGKQAYDSNLRDLGHAYVCVMGGDYSKITDLQKQDITTFFDKRKSMMIFNRYIDATTIKFLINLDIHLVSEIQTSIEDVVEEIDTNLKSLDGFNKSYHESNIISYINDINEVDFIEYSVLNQFSIHFISESSYRLFNDVDISSLVLNQTPVAAYTITSDGIGNILYNGATNIGTISLNGEMVFNAASSVVPDGELNFDITFISNTNLEFQKEAFLAFEPISYTVIR